MGDRFKSEAFLYALPYEYYETQRIRKYGFHGISCLNVSREAARMLGEPLETLKMIICHLGSGVTVSAIKEGKSIDTSMGMTPLDGLMMGTRSGDIDPGVIFYLHRQMGLTIDRVEDILNKESGLLGVSGISSDIREIEEKAKSGHRRCQLALQMFAYRVKEYIGAYTAALGGIDTLIFTAGIGENSPLIRSMICEGLEYLGIELDQNTNCNTKGIQQLISAQGSSVSVFVIPACEEDIIASDTCAIAGLASKFKS